MANILPSQVASVFTKSVIATYEQIPEPTEFLMSFFPRVENESLDLSVESRDGTEFVAKDVPRGTHGTRNKKEKKTERIITPPYFQEETDVTQFEIYHRMFGSAGLAPDMKTVSSFSETIARELVENRSKILRAYEIQASQVLQTGTIVTLEHGSYDFGRKAASLFDASTGTGFWSGASSDPLADLARGCTFIRQKGRVRSKNYIAIFSESALTAMLNNTNFNNQANLRRVEVIGIQRPRFEATGSVFHGFVTAGSYNVEVWTYPEFFDTDMGVSTPYITGSNVVILPENPEFVHGFAGVPQLVETGQQGRFAQAVPLTSGAFVTTEYVDVQAFTHIFKLMSAGLTIPVDVNHVFTIQTLA